MSVTEDVEMPRPMPLPATDEHSDEDSLVGGTLAAPDGRPPQLVDPELAELLRPRRGTMIRGHGRPVGLGPDRVACATPVSDAIIEDRG